MGKRQVFAAALLAGLGLSAAAHATVFSEDGTIDMYTVTQTGLYQITAIGAAGGNDSTYAAGYGTYGGQGAEVQGTFNLTAGTVLDILVGQQGDSGTIAGGGGGGSFVVTSMGMPLAVAGGGGGGSDETAGLDASTSTSGVNGYYPSGSYGYGGSGGGGGKGNYAAGGGGLTGSGTDSGPADFSYYGQAGRSFTSGGAGGIGTYHYSSTPDDGGFGGGGGGSAKEGAGGGGGGYSGGGGGDLDYGGGGGGSYLDASATDPLLLTDASTGNGQITITELALPTPVPEPASIGVLVGGVSLLLGIRNRRRGGRSLVAAA